MDSLGPLMAFGGTYLAISLAGMLLAVLVGYLILKAAVRNGMIEAIQKTGGLAAPTYVQGYPPSQDLGAPLPPSHTGG